MKRLFPVSLAIALVLAVAPVVRAQPKTRTVDECIADSTRAQTERAAGHLRAARNAANNCVDPHCPTPIRKDCDAWSNEIAEAIPTILFRVRDPNDADVVATITVDGVAIPVDGRPHELDPGAHEVEVTASGLEPLRTTVVAEERSHGRVVELRLRRETPVATPPPTPDARTPRTSPASVTWVASGALAVVGVAGLGLFAGVGLDADADYRRLRDTCRDTCARNDTDSVRTRFQVADVALAVGAVSLAAAVVVYLVGPREKASEIRTALRF